MLLSKKQEIRQMEVLGFGFPNGTSIMMYSPSLFLTTLVQSASDVEAILTLPTRHTQSCSSVLWVETGFSVRITRFWCYRCYSSPTPALHPCPAFSKTLNFKSDSWVSQLTHQRWPWGIPFIQRSSSSPRLCSNYSSRGLLLLVA